MANLSTQNDQFQGIELIVLLNQKILLLFDLILQQLQLQDMKCPKNINVKHLYCT